MPPQNQRKRQERRGQNKNDKRPRSREIIFREKEVIYIVIRLLIWGRIYVCVCVEAMAHAMRVQFYSYFTTNNSKLKKDIRTCAIRLPLVFTTVNPRQSPPCKVWFGLQIF